MSNSQDHTPENGRNHSSSQSQTRYISYQKSVFDRRGIDSYLVDLPTFSNAVKRILARLTVEKHSATSLHSLAQSPVIFARLLKYAEDPTNEHHITFRSFSRVREDDIHKMGVEILPVSSHQSLMQSIHTLLDKHDLEEFLTEIDPTAFPQSAGDRAFESRAESRARLGIHQIMSVIINELQARQIILVEDHVLVARMRSQVLPVEIQHKSDGIVHSYFLTGVLDFLCCSTSIDELPLGYGALDKALVAWNTSSTPHPNTKWNNIQTFLDNVSLRARVLEKQSDGPKTSPRWHLLVIEAKSRDAPSTSQPDIPRPPVLKCTSDPESKLQKLFLLDPDRWLDAHKNLKSLLPSNDNGLHHEVLDRYLSVAWHSLRNNGYARYIPFHFLVESSPPNQSQIESFRHISGLPPSPDRCPLKPVVGVIRHEGRYFVVVVPHVVGQDEKEKWIYIIGDITRFDRYSDILPLAEGVEEIAKYRLLSRLEYGEL